MWPLHRKVRHQQPVDEHVERRVLEPVVFDEHFARHADDQVVFVDAIGGHAQARVADELAEQQQAIRRLDDLAQRLRADAAEIRADELRMAGRKHAAPEKRRRHRNLQTLGELEHLLRQMKPVHLDADDQHRILRGRQPADDLLRRFFDGALVDAQLDLLDARERADVGEHHVARHFEIDRPLELERHLDGLANLRRGRARIVEHRAELGDFLINLELRVVRLHLVMHLHAEALLRFARAAGDDDQRRFFGVRARDGVEQIEAAGAVRDDADAEAVGDARRRRRRRTRRRARGSA